MKLQGTLADMSWGELLTALRPGGPWRARVLVETGNPYLALANPRDTEADADAGRDAFRKHCTGCHGWDGRGGTGPDLAEAGALYGSSDLALFRTISRGVPGTAMPPADLPESAVWQVIAWLRRLGVSAPRDGASAASRLPGERTSARGSGVTRERLEGADREPANWLMYSGDYRGHRFSPLNDVGPANVSQLDVLWVRQLPTAEARVESTPLVVDGIMYLTEPPAAVLALDAGTGELVWRATRPLPERILACCGLVNRGLAILGGRLYMGTMDAHLVAFDARTGATEWAVEVADHRDGYSITGAPLAVRDRIVVGVGGGEFGIAGFLDAYDAVTGHRLWRFHTVPRPGEPGHETWAGESWRTGGAATWMTGSFDPELGLVYWGVGNPAPAFQGEGREGDNLYSNSVIALDVETGDLRWHFQFTPHDVHDWDSAQVPVLADLEYEGKPRRVMLWANRNAFFYALDRETGAFLFARELARQSWAREIDVTGRPVVDPGSHSTPRGALVWPGTYGGANWWSPSYSPLAGLFYVSVLEGPHLYISASATYARGRAFVGGASHQPVGHVSSAALRALSPHTGEVRWEHELSTLEAAELSLSGVLSTGGGLVFAADGESLLALDASSGELLWRFRTGGTISTAPISYEVDGRQVIAVTAGRSIFAFALER